jgi:hypothetical protein
VIARAALRRGDREHRRVRPRGRGWSRRPRRLTGGMFGRPGSALEIAGQGVAAAPCSGRRADARGWASGPPRWAGGLDARDQRPHADVSPGGATGFMRPCSRQPAPPDTEFADPGMKMRARRDPPLARGRGRRRRLRAAGRRDPADLRRVRQRHDRAPRPRPPRAGRRAHGRGLRRASGRSVSRSPPPAPGQRTSSRPSPTRGWTRRRSSASPDRCARR